MSKPYFGSKLNVMLKFACLSSCMAIHGGWLATPSTPPGSVPVLLNNGFINPTRLRLLCEKTGALAIVEPGLTTGWQAGR